MQDKTQIFSEKPKPKPKPELHGIGLGIQPGLGFGLGGAWMLAAVSYFSLDKTYLSTYSK